MLISWGILVGMKIVVGLATVIALVAVAYYVYTNATVPTVPAMQAAPSTVTAQLPTTQVSAAIVGKWRSNDDAKFTREFKSDGTVTDAYEGDDSATTVGEWSLFTSANADAGFPGTIAAGVMYLQMTTQYEAMFFTVLNVDAEGLQLSYVDRGNTLAFTRVK